NLPPVTVEAIGGAPEADEFAPLPSRFFEPLPPDEDLPKPLSPSGASVLIDEAREPAIDARSPVLDAEIEPGFAVLRGLALHKLLQMLPGVAAPERAGAAARYLARAGAGWPEEEREKALASIEAILD